MSQQTGSTNDPLKTPIFLAIIVHRVSTKLMLAHQLTTFFTRRKKNS